MNHLRHSTSPYLLQHQDNPVEWYSWGPEAFQRATAEDKPILLSIGYSACHWCHVMAHESFEEPDTAQDMNRWFINIKLDREERPDIDHLYQQAHHILTGRNGGWPLTVFMTADQKPFFAGTYFPSTPRYGMPAFRQILQQIHAVWRNDRPRIVDHVKQVLELLKEEHRTDSPGAPWTPVTKAAVIHRATQALIGLSDRRHGGFGGAPKFPHPADLHFLLAQSASHPEALEVSRAAFHGMANRGLFDQLGGGFYRYCVDDAWAIPHFEKMLYDNGALLAWLAELYRHTPHARIQEVAELTVGWLRREMQSPDGLFYAALDADSEGEEGLYYVWPPQEAEQVLGAEEYALLAPILGFDQPPNFEHQAWHCHWHLTEETPPRIARLRDELLRHRAQRVRPGLDNKVLTAWNALMISGLVNAGHAFQNPLWEGSAKACLNTLLRAVTVEHTLHSVFAGGRAQFKGHLDDHAFLLAASLEVLAVDFDEALYRKAIWLAECLLDEFEDAEHGGFFFTSSAAEALISRPKHLHDGSTPSGYGVATQALLWMSALSFDERYARAAERALDAARPQLERRPESYATLLSALAEFDAPMGLIVLRGDALIARRWRHALPPLPATRVFVVPASDAPLPPGLNHPLPASGVVAYVCQGTQCLPPIKQLEDLLAVCKSGTAGR